MKIILGICGSIAAYKTPELIRTFVKAGVSVVPVLTQKGALFVTPTSLQTVALHPVYTQDTYSLNANIAHLSVLKECDALVIAPASANTIAKLAYGVSDGLLTSIALAYSGPKIVVPAMHHEMWINPITQDNIHRLKSFGFIVLGPASGELACKDEGMGRMVDPELILLQIKLALLPGLPKLNGKRILISCGGTREALDTVRFIGNYSSGKSASTLAHTASLFGAEVTVVSTVPLLENPHIKQIDHVTSHAEMSDALHRHFPRCDALFMAAAVSDYTIQTAPTKLIRKEHISLNLDGTPDILKSLSERKESQTMIGFCLGHPPLKEMAEKKLQDKELDFIIANAPNQFGKEHRTVTILSKEGSCVEHSNLTLEVLAHKLLGLV